jgi:hypothetical protein
MKKTAKPKRENFIERLGRFMRENPEPIEYVPRKIDVTREMIEAGDRFEILEPVAVKMLEMPTGAAAEAVLATFTLGQRKLFGVHTYLTEVCSGGHDVFFRYSGGLVWPDAVAGLDMLGAYPARDILIEATKRFPEPPSLEFDAREKALKKMPDGIFNYLDSRLFEVSDQVDELLRAYVRTHVEEFLFSGTVIEKKYTHELDPGVEPFKWVPKSSK